MCLYSTTIYRFTRISVSVIPGCSAATNNALRSDECSLFSSTDSVYLFFLKITRNLREPSHRWTVEVQVERFSRRVSGLWFYNSCDIVRPDSYWLDWLIVNSNGIDNRVVRTMTFTTWLIAQKTLASENGLLQFVVIIEEMWIIENC